MTTVSMVLQQNVFIFTDAKRGQGVCPPPLQKLGVLSNTGPGPLKNQKATKPAFNVRPSLARQRNTLWMVFSWRANNGPFYRYLDSLYPHKTKKTLSEMAPLMNSLWQNFLDPHMFYFLTLDLITH